MNDETVSSIEMDSSRLLTQQIRDYATVGRNMFWQRQIIYTAAIVLAAYYYDLWLAISTVAVVALSEIYDYILFRQIAVWRGRSPRIARHFLWRIYFGTIISAAVICIYTIGIALEQGPTTHFMSLFFLFAASLFAAMNNHQLLQVLVLRLTIYGVTFLFIPLYDIIRTGAPLSSELWMQFFAVLFVIYFIVDCSRIYMKLYRTNQRQHEALKVEYEKTKIAYQIKSEFLSTISHELRTPMTSIRGSLDLVCGGAMGEIPEKADKALRIAQRNSRHLMSLINEILDLQKMEAGKISLSVEPLELHALLDDAIDLNAGYAETLSVDLVKGQFDKDIVIQADEKRMQQVMSNLLSNAAKFSKPGSKVIVSSEIFEDFARILVIDEGIGLSEDHRHKVFDQFSQVDSSDQRAVNGTGLGMNISKRIIEAQGGAIDYRKNSGPGTTFFVDIPLMKGQQTVQEMRRVAKEGRSNFGYGLFKTA